MKKEESREVDEQMVLVEVNQAERVLLLQLPVRHPSETSVLEVHPEKQVLVLLLNEKQRLYLFLYLIALFSSFNSLFIAALNFDVFGPYPAGGSALMSCLSVLFVLDD